MRNRVIDDEIQLVKYYPNYKTALEWYQELSNWREKKECRNCMQRFILLIRSPGECLKVWDLSGWMRKSTGWCCKL